MLWPLDILCTCMTGSQVGSAHRWNTWPEAQELWFACMPQVIYQYSWLAYKRKRKKTIIALFLIWFPDSEWGTLLQVLLPFSGDWLLRFLLGGSNSQLLWQCFAGQKRWFGCFITTYSTPLIFPRQHQVLGEFREHRMPHCKAMDNKTWFVQKISVSNSYISGMPCPWTNLH